MVTSELTGTQVKVALKGRLDTAGVGRIETRLVATVVPRGLTTIIDLSHVEFVASMGIRMLISIARALSQKNARLVLYGPQEGVREVFDTVSLGAIILIRENESEALAALKA